MGCVFSYNAGSGLEGSFGRLCDTACMALQELSSVRDQKGTGQTDGGDTFRWCGAMQCQEPWGADRTAGWCWPCWVYQKGGKAEKSVQTGACSTPGPDTGPIFQSCSSGAKALAQFAFTVLQGVRDAISHVCNVQPRELGHAEPPGGCEMVICLPRAAVFSVTGSLFYYFFFMSRLTICNYLHGKEISKRRWLFNVSGISLGSSSGWRLKPDTFR